MKTLQSFLVLGALASVWATAASSAERPRVTAVRLTSPVTIDGALSESVWSQAPACSDFVQGDPVQGAAPSQRTEVRLGYDDEALYVGVRSWDAHPDSILARLSRRDVSISADRFAIYLDPYLDRRSGFYFMVNAAGTVYDGTLSNDGYEDSSWDGVWTGKARRDEQGWTCEMRVPFSQLRFNHGERQVWGVNYRRVIARNSEQVYLVYPPRGEAGFVSRFGDIEGLDGLRPGRSVEVMPYVTTKGEYLRHDTGDPFRTGSAYTPDGGLDLRAGLGRLTLNATVNPDFGQVEVDPAVVNLSDVESFFDEKRPFFVEGISNFRFGNEGANDYSNFNWPEPMFFYSRRIGRAPQVVDYGARYNDVPVGTRILGAAKLTGKLTPTTNFGMLHALTGREIASYQAGASRWDAEAEPLTYYGATHALKEFKDRRQGLGLMTTLVARSFGDGGLDDALNRSSLMTGVDGWMFLDRDKLWVLSGYSAVSHVEGTRDRVSALQQDPRHYLQRPDQRNYRFDPDATSLTGFVHRYWLNKQNGNVLLNAGAGAIDPRFDVNDMGFERRAGVLNGHLMSGYQWTQTNSWRRYANLLGSVFGTWDYDGDRMAAAWWTSGRVNWANNWQSRLNVDQFLPWYDDRATRGGPLMLQPLGREFYAYVQTDDKRPVSYALESSGLRMGGARIASVTPTVMWKPVSSVSLSVGPGFERVIEEAQYVTSVSDPAATATYGNRYVFAHLDQKTLYASLRLDWSFTPRLSLQLYAQPLVSSARFTDYKELARPRTRDFTHYGTGVSLVDGDVNVTPASGSPFSFGDRDFDFKSLRGNAVLRWEYLPGSTFYAVWTQERVDDGLLREFGVGRSLSRLLETRASNIFVVKATRYFSL